MHLEAHAALGWVIGHCAPANRRARNWCVLGAVLPDLDALPYVFGPEAYGHWHHTFGHNVFLGLAVAVAAGCHDRSARAALLGGLAFASHLITDAYFSGWYLYLFWPFSREGYLPAWHVGLEHPLNVAFIYLGILACLLIAFFFHRTPLDVFSTRWDRVIVSCFRRRSLTCAICHQPGNQTCAGCIRPLCASHSSVNRRAEIRCPTCAGVALEPTGR